MTSGCGGNANGCGGSLQGWSESYPSNPNGCINNGNCTDQTGRITTVVVRVFRASGSDRPAPPTRSGLQ